MHSAAKALKRAKTQSAVSSNNTVKPITSSSRTIGKVVLSVKDVVMLQSLSPVQLGSTWSSFPII